MRQGAFWGAALLGVLLCGCSGGGSKTDAVFDGRLGSGDKTIGDKVFVDAYSGIAASSGKAHLKLDSSDFGPEINVGVINGSQSIHITAETQADKGQSANLDFDVTQGTTYFIYVRAGGLQGSGDYTLRVSNVLQGVHEQSSLTPGP